MPKSCLYSRYASFILLRARSASALPEFAATTASYFFNAKISLLELVIHFARSQIRLLQQFRIGARSPRSPAHKP
jgi:hypothetical protein